MDTEEETVEEDTEEQSTEEDTPDEGEGNDTEEDTSTEEENDTSEASDSSHTEEDDDGPPYELTITTVDDGEPIQSFLMFSGGNGIIQTNDDGVATIDVYEEPADGVSIYALADNGVVDITAATRQQGHLYEYGKTTSVEVHDDTEVQIETFNEPLCSTTITVLDEAEEPIVGATIDVDITTTAGAFANTDGSTNKAGEAIIDERCGEWTIDVSADGFESNGTTIDASGVDDVTIGLESPSTPSDDANGSNETASTASNDDENASTTPSNNSTE